jgi:hypothetical protein
MGFPNIDKFLVKRFLEEFALIQTDPQEVVDDIFEEMDPEERKEVCTYLVNTNFTRSLEDRPENQRSCYVIPHWPVAEVPFPQIGISLGEEAQADKFLGDYTGQSTPVVSKQTGETIAWKIPKGYLSMDSWMIDVVCGTKDEAIWLTNLCKYFILKALPDLSELGLMEAALGINDVKLDQNSMTQPITYFVRTIRLSGKKANTWSKKVPAQYYQEGVNLAVESVTAEKEGSNYQEVIG